MLALVAARGTVQALWFASEAKKKARQKPGQQSRKVIMNVSIISLLQRSCQPLESAGCSRVLSEETGIADVPPHHRRRAVPGLIHDRSL